MSCKAAVAALSTILAEHLNRSPSKAASMMELIEVGRRAGMTPSSVRSRIQIRVMAGEATCLPIDGEVMVQLVGGDV